MEGDGGVSAGNAVHKLGAAAAGGPVMHQDAEIHLFIGLAEVEGLQGELRAGAREIHAHVNVPGFPGKHHVLQFQLFPGFHYVRHTRHRPGIYKGIYVSAMSHARTDQILQTQLHL